MRTRREDRCPSGSVQVPSHRSTSGGPTTAASQTTGPGPTRRSTGYELHPPRSPPGRGSGHPPQTTDEFWTKVASADGRRSASPPTHRRRGPGRGSGTARLRDQGPEETDVRPAHRVVNLGYTIHHIRRRVDVCVCTYPCACVSATGKTSSHR